jgi:hypothetical protein
MRCENRLSDGTRDLCAATTIRLLSVTKLRRYLHRGTDLTKQLSV